MHMPIGNIEAADRDPSLETPPDEDLLDETLNESFPASDPPTANQFD